ncbi:hypothetical protein [Maribacter sp. 2307ULW6-5]
MKIIINHLPIQNGKAGFASPHIRSKRIRPNIEVGRRGHLEVARP